MTAMGAGKATLGGGLHLAALLLLAAVSILHVPLAQPLTDAFQEGEYATFGFLAQTQPNFRMPVLIHGGLDVIPSRAAALACRADRQVICVRTINLLIQLATAGLFVGVLAIVAGLGTGAALIAGLPAVAMLWLLNAPTLMIMVANQGVPSVRDLFVVAGLLVMAWVCRRLDRGAFDNTPLLVLLGVLAGVGVFWAYNRGLLLGLVVATFAVGASLLRRSPLPLLLVALGGAAGSAAVVAAGGPSFVSDTVFDFSYWSRNSGIWHTPLEPDAATFMCVLTACVLIGALPVACQSLRSGRSGRALLLAVLAAIYGLYVIQSLNRPDLVHMRWVVWPATLILAIVICAWLDRANFAQAHTGGVRVVIVLVVAGACIESYADNSMLRIVGTGLADNARLLIGRAPTDRELAGEDLDRVADLVAASGRCTFAANNAGIVYLLSRQPPCSRFAFGTYIAADRQAEVIAALQAAQPGIILWDSSNWYSRIDNRSFRDRTPVLADWIESHYPVRTTIGGQVLLSRTALAP
jgi:hypothetical protein